MKKISQQFKDKRKKLGISVEQVSQQIKINKNDIEIFESGDFQDSLDNKIYIIGFIRSYSDYLKLDSNEIIGLYKKHLSESEQPPGKYKKFFKPKTIYFSPGEAMVKTNLLLNIICFIFLVFAIIHFTEKNLEYQKNSSDIVNEIIFE